MVPLVGAGVALNGAGLLLYWETFTGLFVVGDVGLALPFWDGMALAILCLA